MILTLNKLVGCDTIIIVIVVNVDMFCVHNRMHGCGLGVVIVI